MKDEEFYSTIKIVTGEEIVAKVIYLEDEDKVCLLYTSPSPRD